MAISGLFLADILWLNLLPTATAAIGWKYYLVFVSLAVAHTIYMALFLPDVSSCFFASFNSDNVLCHRLQSWPAEV